jgi:spore coat protein A
MSNLKKLQFKTKLPSPNTLSFINNSDPISRAAVEMKAGITTIYHDEDTNRKMTVPFWGYALEGEEATYLGPTIEVNSKQCVEIDWTNAIGLNEDGTDQQLRQPVVAIDVEYNEGATEIIPQNVLGVPEGAKGTMGACGRAYVTPHQHGGKTAPKYDGGPLDMMSVGQSHLHRYENNQRAAMLWYHDHAMHTTRLNAFAGLAALYIIRDEEESALGLPCGDYELPLVIQDRNLTDPEKIDDLIMGNIDTAKVRLLHKVESEEGPLEFFGPLNLMWSPLCQQKKKNC